MQSHPNAELSNRDIDTLDRPPTVRKSRARRSKYTARACTLCRRRKVKCSGGEPCTNCAIARSKCGYHTEEARSRSPRPKRRYERQRQDDLSSNVLPGTNRSESDVLERLLRLEEEIRGLADSRQSGAEANNHSTDSWSDQNLGLISLHGPKREIEHDREEGIDDIQHGRRGFVSIAAQIEMLKKGPCRNINFVSEATQATYPAKRDPITSPRTSTNHFANSIRCSLCPSERLEYLVQLFFKEFGVFYPCIQQDDFYPRLQRLLQYDLPDQARNTLPIDQPEKIALAALTCVVLAIAEFLETSSKEDTNGQQQMKENIRTHQTWYLESTKLLTVCPRRKSTHLDFVRLYMLQALYMLMIERLGDSSLAISTAVELAFALDLNDETCWVSCSEKEKRTRRVLWWTLYLFDRRIAQKLGRPYLIRENETLVEDFCADLANEGICSVQTRETSLESHDQQQTAHFSNRLDPYLYDQDWYFYLQFHIKWSRLFSKAWDALFALRAPKAGDAEEVESTEALLLKLKRNLPADMDWEAHSLSDCINAGVPDRKLRLRLYIFTRTNLLWLLIRHSLILRGSQKNGADDKFNNGDYQYTVKLCRILATRTIDAVAAYMRSRRQAHSFSTYATMTIIECLYHLIALPPPDLEVTSPGEECDMDTFIEQARQCLDDMARSGMRIAQNALKVLTGIGGRQSKDSLHQSNGSQTANSSSSSDGHLGPEVALKIVNYRPDGGSSGESGNAFENGNRLLSSIDEPGVSATSAGTMVSQGDNDRALLDLEEDLMRLNRNICD